MPAEARRIDDAGVLRPSRARTAIAIVLGAAPIVAMAVGAWMLWQEQRGERVSGDLSVLAMEAAAADAPRLHPLVGATELGGWTRAVDAEALGRGGTGMLDDAQRVFGDGSAARRAVPAVDLPGGMVAWASPRMVRVLGPDGSEVARVDACSDGIDAVVQAGERLVVAGCGRIVAVGSGGVVRWRAEPAGEGPVQLVAAGSHLLVTRGGSRHVERYDAATGAREWSRRLEAPARTMRVVGGERVAVTTNTDGGARVTMLELEDGAVVWQRRWRGWQATAMGTDGQRVVAALVGAGSGERCGDSGLVELDAATGASTGTRRLDSRLAVRDLRADGATRRMAGLAVPRGCTLQAVEPRIEIYTARGLGRLHMVDLPGRPCSGLVARRGLFATATCDELVGVDAHRGTLRWTQALPSAATRRSVALDANETHLTATDDVGTIAVVEAAA